MRKGRHLMVGKDRLYDLQKDPGQETDIAAEHPELLKDLNAAFDKWWKKTRPLMVNEETPNSETQPFPELYQKQVEGGGIPDWQAPEL